MLSKILAYFFDKQPIMDPFVFCQDKDKLESYLQQQNIKDTAVYIKENLTKALDMLIHDDRFNRELLASIEQLAKDFGFADSLFSFSIDKAKLKFDMIDEIKASGSSSLRYPDNIDFEIETTEVPLWQWNSINILASYKAVVLGKDVLNGCGCITKVRDCCVTEQNKASDFLSSDMLSFAKIEDNTALITDKNLYIKSSKSYDKVLIDSLTAKYISTRGFAISTEALKGRILIFKINDPIFMNLLLNKDKEQVVAQDIKAKVAF